MSKVPSLAYFKIINAMQRLGFVVVRQRGSHIRMQHRDQTGELIKITIPAHQPVLRSTLAHILKDARVSLERFLDAV